PVEDRDLPMWTDCVSVGQSFAIGAKHRSYNDSLLLSGRPSRRLKECRKRGLGSTQRKRPREVRLLPPIHDHKFFLCGDRYISQSLAVRTKNETPYRLIRFLFLAVEHDKPLPLLPCHIRQMFAIRAKNGQSIQFIIGFSGLTI